jgi:hypothetical protein
MDKTGGWFSAFGWQTQMLGPAMGKGNRVSMLQPLQRQR